MHANTADTGVIYEEATDNGLHVRVKDLCRGFKPYLWEVLSETGVVLRGGHVRDRDKAVTTAPLVADEHGKVLAA